MVDYDPTAAAPAQVFPFEDLPSEDTPVTAAWLNHVHDILADVAGNSGRLEFTESAIYRSPVSARITVDPQAYVFDSGDLVACTIPTYDSSGVVVHPSVKFFPDGWNGHRYWLAITPYTSLDAEVENPSILVSDDGTTWSVPAGVTNPLVASPAGAWYNSDPHLTMGPDGRMYMFFREVREDAGTENIRYIATTDGVTWTTPVQIVQTTIATEGMLSPCVWWDAAAGEWVMLAVDYSPADATHLTRRTSTTLEGTWSASADVTITPALAADRGIWHLDAHPVGGQVVALFSDHTISAGSGIGFLYWAVSDDQGATFTRAADPYGTAASYYRSAFVPMLQDNGLGFDTWIGTLSTVSRVTTDRRNTGGVSDHGALTGLADNDHPQYLRAAVLIPALLMDSSPITAATYAKTGNGLWPVWVFDPSTNQGIMGANLIPASSTTSYDVRVHWCNLDTGAGDVRWEVTIQSFSASGTAGSEQVTVAAPTAAGQYVPQTVVTGTVTLDASHTLLHVRAWRLADHGTDTLANTAGLIAISLSPA